MKNGIGVKMLDLAWPLSLAAFARLGGGSQLRPTLPKVMLQSFTPKETKSPTLHYRGSNARNFSAE